MNGTVIYSWSCNMIIIITENLTLRQERKLKCRITRTSIAFTGIALVTHPEYQALARPACLNCDEVTTMKVISIQLEVLRLTCPGQESNPDLQGGRRVPVFRIQIYLFQIRIQHFGWITMRIRIQGFDDPKPKKISSWKNIIFFIKNWNLPIPRPL